MQAASEPTQAEGGAPPSQEAGMCKLLTDLDLLNRTMGDASHPLNDDHQVGLLLPTAELLARHSRPLSWLQCTAGSNFIK